jgi:hypothetical protein
MIKAIVCATVFFLAVPYVGRAQTLFPIKQFYSRKKVFHKIVDNFVD